MPATLQNALLWNAYARVYDWGVNGIGSKTVGAGYVPYAEMMGKAVNHVSRSRADRLLDLGCGTGNFPKALRTNGWGGQYFGVDSSPAMLSRAKGKNQDSRDAFFCETFEQFTGRGVKKNGQYDVVSALNSLYVLTDKAQIVSVLNGIREHLVDGGQFMASILHEIDPENMLRAQFGLPRTEPKNDMASALKLGFSHDPLLTLRLFLPGVITKILGASSNTLLDKATWTRLIESAGLVIDDAAGYYGGANYGEPLPGTFFLAHKA